MKNVFILLDLLMGRIKQLFFKDTRIRERILQRILLSSLLLIGMHGIHASEGPSNAHNKDQRTYRRDTIMWAASKGDLDTVKFWINENPQNIFNRDKHNNTALSWAASKGYEDIVRLVLQTPQELNEKRNLLMSKDNKGALPVTWAVIYDHYGIAELLFKAAQQAQCLQEILLHSDKQKGDTVASWAAGQGRAEIFSLIMRNAQEAHCIPAVILHRNNDGRSILANGVMAGNLRIVQDVLRIAKENVSSSEFNDLVNVRDTMHRRTALHEALRYIEGSVEKERKLYSEDIMLAIVQEILKYPEVNSKLTDEKGYTPLYWARALNKQKIVDVLQAYMQAQTNRERAQSAQSQSSSSLKRPAENADEETKKRKLNNSTGSF